MQATASQGRGGLDAAKAQLLATRAQVTTAEVALNGVREEPRVGHCTTLDVLEIGERLDGMIDRLMKRLLFVRGLKSITASPAAAPRHPGTKKALRSV